MPTTTTRGNDTQSQTGRQSQRQSGQSSSTQGGFSKLLIDAPGALEEALQKLVTQFLGDFGAEEEDLGPHPTDAAAVRGIQEETFQQGAKMLSRQFGNARADTVTAMANLGLRDSSATSDSFARLGEARTAALERLASSGATEASRNLMALRESRANRGVARRGQNLGAAGTALEGIAALGGLRTSMAQRVFGQTSTGSTSGQSFSQSQMESIRNYFQTEDTPTDWIGLMAGLGGALGGLPIGNLFGGGGGSASAGRDLGDGVRSGGRRVVG